MSLASGIHRILSRRKLTTSIAAGVAAIKAKAAGLAAYPGGIVDRVVLLSNGEYSVHMIGINWPHHVFVSTSFRVVGAE